MAEEQAAGLAAAEGGEETQVLDIDPAQLAALLAQSADGTAQLIDEHGNTITLTADQLAEAGIDLQNLEGAQVVQLAEGQQYIQGEDGQIYIIEEDPNAAAGAYVDANSLMEVVPAENVESIGTTGVDISMAKSHLDQRYSQSPATRTRSSGFSPTQKQLQVPAPIMAAPKPIPTMVQQQQPMMTSPVRQSARADHDQHLGGRRDREEQLVSPSKYQYARRPISDQQSPILMNNGSTGVAGDRFASPALNAAATNRRQAMAQKQYADSPRMIEGDSQEMDVTYIQGDGSQISPQLSGPRIRTQPSMMPQLARRGNAQAGLLPFQCDNCPRRFAHDHHLKRHQEMAHAKKRPFFCRYCNRDLYLASDLHFQGHLRMQHKQELDYESSVGGHARVGQGGQQQLHLRTAGPRIPGSSPAQLGGGLDENDEEEPDWDIMEAEKQREVEEQNAANERDAALGKDTADGQAEGQQFHKCGTCGNEFELAADLHKHAKDEHGTEETDASEKQTGTAVAKSSAIYACNVCEKRYSKQEYLDKHKIVHTDQVPFPCQYCPRRFKWKENLVKHLNWHMERMPFKCSLCPKGFPTQTRLDVHIKAKHLPKQREHICPICQKGFYEKEYLAKHMRIHGSKIYPCTECDKKFIDEKFLRRHMMTHTQTRDFACDICGKAFNKAVHLKSHRTIHTGERPYKCSKCPMVFGFKHNLRTHEKSEHGPAAAEKTHSCEYCGRAFAQKNNLDVHLKIHRGIKPFQCSSCLKQFSRLEHLRTHVNAHAGIRDHQCTICDKNFSSKANLRQHLLVHQHDEEGAFHCGSCPKKFRQRQHLAKHVKTHTKNTDVQYVVVWEKGGSLLEATIITDGVAQDATADDRIAAAAGGGALASGTNASKAAGAVTGDGEPMDVSGSGATEVDAAKLLDAATRMGGQVVDLNQLQLVDEEGNPIQGLNADQVLILQDGTIAATSGDGTATAVATTGADSGNTVIDPSMLLAMAAEAQGEDGTIYISEENLQALAQQGVVFTYEEASQ